jgi:hypothetical protein
MHTALDSISSIIFVMGLMLVLSNIYIYIYLDINFCIWFVIVFLEEFC